MTKEGVPQWKIVHIHMGGKNLNIILRITKLKNVQITIIVQKRIVNVHISTKKKKKGI